MVAHRDLPGDPPLSDLAPAPALDAVSRRRRRRHAIAGGHTAVRCRAGGGDGHPGHHRLAHAIRWVAQVRRTTRCA